MCFYQSYYHHFTNISLSSPSFFSATSHNCEKARRRHRWPNALALSRSVASGSWALAAELSAQIRCGGWRRGLQLWHESVRDAATACNAAMSNVCLGIHGQVIIGYYILYSPLRAYGCRLTPAAEWQRDSMLKPSAAMSWAHPICIVEISSRFCVAWGALMNAPARSAQGSTQS